MANNDDDNSNSSDTPPSGTELPIHGREVTGRELIAAAKRGDTEVQALLDPSTAAELAKWFGLPSFSELAERGEAPADVTGESSTFDEQDKAREAAMAAAQPAFLEHIERWYQKCERLKHDDATAERMYERFAHVTTVIEQFAHRLVLQSPVDRERPYAIDDALHICTPQALLRDLFRPADSFTKYFEIDPTREPVFEHKPKMASLFHTPLAKSFTTVLVELRESLAQIREMHASNWAELDLPNRKNTTEEEVSL